MPRNQSGCPRATNPLGYLKQVEIDLRPLVNDVARDGDATMIEIMRIARSQADRSYEEIRKALPKIQEITRRGGPVLQIASQTQVITDNIEEALLLAEFKWSQLVALWHSHQFREMRKRANFELWAEWDTDDQNSLFVRRVAVEHLINETLRLEAPESGVLEMCHKSYVLLCSAADRYKAICKAGGLKVSVSISGGEAEWTVSTDGEGIPLHRLVEMDDDQILAADGIGPKTLAAIRERIPDPASKKRILDGVMAKIRTNGGDGPSVAARATVTVEEAPNEPAAEAEAAVTAPAPDAPDEGKGKKLKGKEATE